ncbi:hypothetical protein EHRUM1_03560 [Ehrlichia ruminantium]|nr:hypothetical protein EHRUM1_03560 [Ehrlichia ruminantium]
MIQLFLLVLKYTQHNIIDYVFLINFRLYVLNLQIFVKCIEFNKVELLDHSVNDNYELINLRLK